MDRLLEVSEVAEVLDVGIDWVYDRLKRDGIPVGELEDTRKTQRVARAALEAFIAERTHPGP